jgi:signal transduction histidine kinase
VYVNPAGCDILGSSWDELEGEPSFLSSVTPGRRTGPDAGDGEGTGSIFWPVSGSVRARELEYHLTAFVLDGSKFTAVTFRDVTDARNRERQLTVFGRAASSLAFAGTLRATLDAICTELVQTARLAAVQILLIDPGDLRLQVHGAAPAAAFPADFTVLLEEVRQRGAELLSLTALRSKRPVTRFHRRQEMLADPDWGPLHDHLRGFEWDSFVSMPVLFQDQSVGIVNAYYPPRRDPDPNDIRFLGAMADQAAVAVKNAQLLSELKGKAALDERHRLARELHDSACQELFSLNLQLRAAQRAAERGTLGDDDALARRLKSIEGLAHSALEDMRALVFELHPPLLHTEGLVAVVRRQAESIAARQGVAVEVLSSSDRLDIDDDAELDAYRLVQEALHNAVKHASASSVRVSLKARPGTRSLELEVTDDGVGFDRSAVVSGLGLLSMRERAERLGAELTLESRPGEGTTVRAVAPRVIREAP